jgi:hypothetical protein
VLLDVIVEREPSLLTGDASGSPRSGFIQVECIVLGFGASACVVGSTIPLNKTDVFKNLAAWGHCSAQKDRTSAESFSALILAFSRPAS